MMALLHVPVDGMMLRPAGGAGKAEQQRKPFRNAAGRRQKAGLSARLPGEKPP